MTISNYDDIIDSRDIIERIEELESELLSLREDLRDAGDDEEEHDAFIALQNWEEDNSEELNSLKALQKEAENYADDWAHGAALIRDSYFTEYAMDMLDDMGMLNKEAWYIVVDEEATARNIQQDYTSVEFDDVTYWVR